MGGEFRADEGIIFALGGLGSLSYNELTDEAIDNTDLSIPTIHKHIRRLLDQGKLIKHKQPKRAGVTYELSEVGRQRYRELAQKRKKDSQVLNRISPDAQVILSVLVKNFCSGPSIEAEFEQRILQRSFAELLSYENIFPKNFCANRTLYAILGDFALKDCRNIFPHITDETYARAVEIDVVDLAYFRKEFTKRVFSPPNDPKEDWFTTPEYEEFLLGLVNFELDNWNNGDAAWRQGNLDWRHDAEIQATLREALPGIIDDTKRILQIVEKPPNGNKTWEANAIKRIKEIIEMLGGEEPEERATMKQLLNELEPSESQADSDPKNIATTPPRKSHAIMNLACEVCGERYPLAQVKIALGAGKMKCSCGNDLTVVARAMLDAKDE